MTIKDVAHKIDWKLSEKFISLLEKSTRKRNPYYNALLKDYKKAIKERNYEKAKEKYILIEKYVAQISGMVIKDLRKWKKKKVESFKKNKGKITEEDLKKEVIK